MTQRNTARTPAASQMLPYAEFIATLNAETGCLTGMLAVKGPNAGINPANLRTVERAICRGNQRLIAHWSVTANRKAYEVLYETWQATSQGSGGGTAPATKARRAGA